MVGMTGLTMAKLLMATAIGAALASTALVSQATAADMASRDMYTKAAPVVAPVTNWSGLYIGGNVGYASGNGKIAFDPLPDAITFGDLQPIVLDNRPQGVIGGAQVKIRGKVNFMAIWHVRVKNTLLG